MRSKIFSADTQFGSGFCYKNKNHKYKRRLSADGISLLPSALRPRLSRAERKTSKIAIFNIIALLSVVALSTLLSSGYVYAASLTLTVPANGLRLDVNPTPEGTYLKSDVGKITVKTDAFAGYTLDIKAKTSSDLMNGENKISSIVEETTEEEYQSNGGKNTWTWQPSKFKSSDNTKFLPAPTLEPAIIEKTNGKNDVENNYDIYIATKVDNTLPTGEYKNDFVLTASANSVPYSIKYEIGEEATGAPEPNPDTGSSTEQTIKLSKTEPTREDYEFLGWCSEETTDENCNGETKQPGDDITLTNSDNQFTFYAIWKHIGPTNLGHLGNMQNFDCNKIEKIEDYGTVTDSRDGNIYEVAKLKDGKCWMVENLKLVGPRTLTSTDSNVSSSFNLPASDNTDWDHIFHTAHIHKATMAGYTDQVYYNWFAATAGTGNSSIPDGVNASGSICPKGWRLPTGGSGGEFETLTKRYSSSTDLAITSAIMQATPVPNFTISGFYYGLDEEYNNAGYYWSSTSGGFQDNSIDSWYSAYLLVFNTSGFWPDSGVGSCIGTPIRCLSL